VAYTNIKLIRYIDKKMTKFK